MLPTTRHASLRATTSFFRKFDVKNTPGLLELTHRPRSNFSPGPTLSYGPPLLWRHQCFKPLSSSSCISTIYWCAVTPLCGADAGRTVVAIRLLQDASHTPAARAPVPADAPEASPAAVILRFRRNPHGVGLWGAGKYHWCPDPHAPRPPCKIVTFETLPETIEVTTEDLDFVPDVGFILHFAGARHQVCRTCALAAQHAGLLLH